MRRLLKIMAGLIAFGVLLVVALLVLVKVLITPERVQQTVVPMVEEALERRVTLEHIQVSLFSGIELQGLKVYEAASEDLFLGCERVRLKYQLLPLLALRVVIDEIRLESPQIRIVRLADGRFNVSDLQAKAAGAGARSSANPESPSEGSSLDLLISQVRLQDGHVIFLDHQLNALAPYRYEISNLQAGADGITLTGTVPIRLACTLNGSRLQIEGRLRPQTPGGSFQVQLQDLDVMAFRPYFAEQLPGKLTSLKLGLEMEVEIEGRRDTLAIKGNLRGEALDLVLDALPQAPISGAVLRLDYDLGLDFAADRLDVRLARLDYNGLVAQASGALLGLSGQPLAELQLTIPGMDLRQALVGLPRDLVGDIADLDPAGQVAGSAKLSGALARPGELLRSAHLSLDKVQASIAGIRASLSGQLELTGDQLVSRELILRMGDNQAEIALAAQSLFNPPLQVQADISSRRFLLDPLLQGAAGVAVAGDKPGGEGGTKPDAAGPADIGPFDLPLQASGSLKFDETLWQGLTIKDFLAEYQLRENRLTLGRIQGQVAGGSFAGTASVDLATRGLAYDAGLGLKAIQADPLLAALWPAAGGTLFGAMDFDVALKGRGVAWQQVSKNLTAQGGLRMVDGRLVSPELLQGFAGFLQLPDLDQIAFRTVQGVLQIVDGQLKIQSSLEGSRFKLAPEGTIGLDGRLKLAMDTRLSPEVVARIDRKGEVLRFLNDAEGWSRLPLLISGSLTAPRFGLDPRGVEAQAGRVIGQELEKQVDKWLRKQQKPATGDPEPAPETTSPETTPTETLIKDSLRKLLGN